LSIEIALQKNPVVLISNQKYIPQDSQKKQTLWNVNLLESSNTAKKFASVYNHLSKDNSINRRRHELQCFQRWFVLNEFMQRFHVATAYFSDGDSPVFSNMTEVYQSYRECSSVINIEPQPSKFHWVAAGEASLWRQSAVNDFCKFIFVSYSNRNYFLQTVKIKFDRSMSSVVDMSLMWLWWTAHGERNQTFENYFQHYLDEGGNIKGYDIKLKAAFDFTKSLPLAPVLRNLTICNGMIARNGYVFDHLHAWQHGKAFSLGLKDNTNESTSPFVSYLSNGRMETLYVHNIHYQGDLKKVLLYDLCRLLLIKSPLQSSNSSRMELKSVCSQIIFDWQKRGVQSCIDHAVAGSNKIVCF